MYYSAAIVKNMPKNLSPGAHVARGATYMFVQGFVASTIGVIYILVITRVLSDTEMGMYATLNLMLSLVQVFGTFALPAAATKYISQYIAEGNHEKAKSIVSRVLQISLITGVGFFIAVSLLAMFLASSLLGSQMYASLFYLLATASIINIFYAQVTAFIQGAQKIFELAIVISVFTALQNAVGISLILMGFGLWGVVFGWMAGLFPSVLIGLIYTKKFVGISKKFHPARPLIKFSFPLYLSNILGFFVGWIDQMLVLFLLSATYGLTEAQRVLGTYYVAVRASVVPGLVAGSIGSALFPKLAELYTKYGSKGLKDGFITSTRYMSMIGFPVIVGLATLSYPIMILFAPNLWEAALPLSILCLAMIPSTLGTAITPTLLTQERIKVASLITAIAVVFEAIISFILLIPVGIVGAALSRMAGSLLTFTLGIFVLRKSLGIAFDKEALWKSSVSSILMVLGIVALDFARQYISSRTIYFDRIFNFSLRLLPIYVIVGAATYFVSLVALRAIKKYDVNLLHDYLPKRLKWIATWLSRVARVK